MADTLTTAAIGMASKRASRLVFYIPLLTAVVTLVLLMLGLTNGWLGQQNNVGTDFGEASRPGLIKQPVNTISSMAFVVSGLYIGWCLMRASGTPNRNPLTQRGLFAGFFASVIVFLGPGSGAMHATESLAGGHVDLLSMYLLAGFLTAYATYRFFRLNRIWFPLLFGTVAGCCFYLQYVDASWPLLGNLGRFMFGFLVVVAAIIEALYVFVRKANHDLKWGILTLGFLLLAYLIWHLSVDTGPSYSLMQGHALWHILCAVAAYCLFRYYVSEDRVQAKALIAAKTESSPLLNNGVPSL